jgi:hypothetical protein
LGPHYPDDKEMGLRGRFFFPYLYKNAKYLYEILVFHETPQGSDGG